MRYAASVLTTQAQYAARYGEPVRQHCHLVVSPYVLSPNAYNCKNRRGIFWSGTHLLTHSNRHVLLPSSRLFQETGGAKPVTVFSHQHVLTTAFRLRCSLRRTSLVAPPYSLLLVNSSPCS